MRDSKDRSKSPSRYLLVSLNELMNIEINVASALSHLLLQGVTGEAINLLSQVKAHLILIRKRNWRPHARARPGERKESDHET